MSLQLSRCRCFLSAVCGFIVGKEFRTLSLRAAVLMLPWRLFAPLQANEYKTGHKAHPPLRCFDQWTKDTPEYCSGFVDDNGPTNAINVDTHLEWVAPGTGSQWVVVDFGDTYAVTALEIVGRPGRAMPKDLQLEVGNSVAGPWRVVKAFLSSAAEEGKPSTEGAAPFSQYVRALCTVSGACLTTHTRPHCHPRPAISPHMIASTHTWTTSRLRRRYFAGFYAKSRYWRLHVLRNYGEMQTRITGVRFYGMDLSLSKWFAEQRLTQYLTGFVEAGCNQMRVRWSKSSIAFPACASASLRKHRLGVAEKLGCWRNITKPPRRNRPPRASGIDCFAHTPPTRH